MFSCCSQCSRIFFSPTVVILKHMKDILGPRSQQPVWEVVLEGSSSNQQHSTCSISALSSGEAESTKIPFFSVLEGRKPKTFVLLERRCCFQRKYESAEAVLKKKREEDSYLSSHSPPAILLPSPLANSPVLHLAAF